MGKDKNHKEVKNFPKELIKNVFKNNNDNSPVLISLEDKYFIFEIIKTDVIQKNINDNSLNNEIKSTIEKNAKRGIVSELINKINKNNFKKTDFDKFSSNNDIAIKNTVIENQNDSKFFKKELVNQIYTFGEKKVIIATDIDLSENYLIYIEKIENTSIKVDSEEYTKYFNISKVKLRNNLYNIYDSYLENKYNIEINYKALESVKNNFK